MSQGEQGAAGPADDAAGPAESADEVLRLEGAYADRDAWTAKGFCRMERALEVVGTRSSMVLVRELLYGAHRFDELARRAGLSEAVAAGRLKQLYADGVVDRRPYQEPGKRTRYEYVLTERGRELYTIFVALIDWGDGLRDDSRTGVQLVHRGCDAPLSAQVWCADGHRVPVEEAAARLRDEPWALRRRTQAGG
ncbi:helix-turn-helix transcriptional regulator [Gordonia desulfuricans]|uniref:Helix-turn-helix transcriptional regulator n=1 Tax=Gordonia desulfuricans TaxID=89051 RepID=A0A7K3LT82_9ACTN|nr:helix-turn-helix domain-containing protein [Gordonia desulfuricans]NDK91211.1 helix-turn-helix transcriptional regulator [Gordonia desulfuricans]